MHVMKSPFFSKRQTRRVDARGEMHNIPYALYIINIALSRLGENNRSALPTKGCLRKWINPRYQPRLCVFVIRDI